MYNKIAPIILNSGKTPGASTVFVSQPEPEKEKIAGKLFVLAEIGGKKSEGEKIINFLINDLEDNYYNDEKVLLVGKIEGLKAENIFEAGLAKTNKNLHDFLAQHKLKINPGVTSITLGLINGHNLHFTSFGKNRSLLIYRRQDGYEIINVETSAKNSTENKEEVPGNKNANLFSSVVSGEIPLGSFFIFASESLPEYLSGREMVEIVTKLPPIVAAEQIKNVLSKINSYVPFLGIIIKNTTDSSGQEIKEAAALPRSAQTSISSLNYTEQKTENMLSPAGLISWRKAARSVKNFFINLKKPATNNHRRPAYKDREGSSAEEIRQRPEGNQPTEKGPLNLPSANSFFKAPKVMLRGSTNIWGKTKLVLNFFLKIFNPKNWLNFFKNFKPWLKSLNAKNRYLFIGLVVVVLFFVIALMIQNDRRNQAEAEAAFNALVYEIENKEVLIDSHLLYNDEDGASRVLADVKRLIEALPREKDYQIAAYEKLLNTVAPLEEKILKITRIDNLEIVKDLPAHNLRTLTLAKDKLYSVSNNGIAIIPLTGEQKEVTLDLAEQINFSRYDDKDTVYFRANEKIHRLDINSEQVTSTDLSNHSDTNDYSGFSLFNAAIYQADRFNNQLYKYTNNGANRSDWLKEAADLTTASDLYIDGRIYVLNNNGRVIKFFTGLSESYNSLALKPETNEASRILGDDKQLYILDPANQRLAILAKDDGHLMGQYIFSSLRIKDMALDSTNKVIYFLANNGIYKFPLTIN